jgi:hypothetical protein
VNTCPPIFRVPERDVVLLLPATVKLTEVFPVPLALEFKLIHATVLEAFQEHPGPVVRSTLPLPPAAANEPELEERAKVHGASAVNVVALAMVE